MAHSGGVLIANICGGEVGSAHGCGWSNVSGCSSPGSLGSAMRDHEIVSVIWEHAASPPHLHLLKILSPRLIAS